MEVKLPELRLKMGEGGSVADLPSAFGGDFKEFWLEIGFGAGEQIAHLAASNPSVGLLGCEPFVNGVASLLDRMVRDNIENIRIFDDDARLLLPQIPEKSFSRIFLLFPDPWPKKRHRKRRFVSPEALDQMARLLADGGEFRFASDIADYVRWTLEMVTRHPAFEWPAGSPRDWRERPAEFVETRYETKALTAGRRCSYLSFRRKSR